MKLENLIAHPENERIYTPTDLEELENSLSSFGQMEPDNKIISLIEHNRHRQKSSTYILNEARYLETQLKDIVGSGRSASSGRSGKKKDKRVTMVMELSQRLGVGTTKLKLLLSISNYKPELMSKLEKKYWWY